jgi:hypothetical protein
MSLPTNRDVHVNQVLTDWALQYSNELTDFKADQLAPIVPSKKQSNAYFTYEKADWFRDEMKERGDGAPVPMAGYRVNSDNSFTIKVWSIGKPIDDQEEDNQDDPLSADEDATKFVTDKERIRREKAFAAACMATSKWGTDVTGNTSASVYGSNTVAQWEDSDSTPLEDVAYYRTKMKLATGLNGNVLVLGRQVWDVLKNHPDLLARISGGSNNGNPAKVTQEIVAQIMELEELVVMEAVENTAIEGATMTGAFIAGKHGLLMHRNKTAGRKGATAVKTFTWQRPKTDANGIAILKYPGATPHQRIVECESNFTHKIVATDLGVFFNGLVA